MLKQADSTIFDLVGSSLDTISTSVKYHGSAVWVTICETADLSMVWKTLILILIALNLKVFPFIYHLRVLNAVRFVLKSQRPPQPITSSHLFQPMITSSRACLMEIDVLGHKSNSTYFLDVDIARAHLVTTLFSTAIEKFRGSTTMNGLSGKPKTNFTLALGAVSCTFRKELRPYEEYDMWTRILSWDHKWFYLVTHFVKKGAKLQPDVYTLYPRQNKESAHSASIQNGVKKNSALSEKSKHDASPICASALSKVVFKDSRITIAPEIMLEAAGLLPAKQNPDDNKPQKSSDDQLAAKAVDEQLLQFVNDSTTLSADALSARSAPDHCDSYSTMPVTWTARAIEAERQRGMRIAKMLGEQVALENEFNHQLALGHHYDGHGIEGVIATLAQLGKISGYQLL